MPCYAVSVYEVAVVERVNQDETIFTQGLVFKGNWFYQSSGLYGKSFLLRYSNNDNQRLTKLDVPPNIFAEGITVLGDNLFLISWKAGTAWRFNAETLQLEKTFHYSGEGWGLTDNGEQLILSDGSDTIKFISPEDFSTQGTISVKLSGAPVSNLNELEYVEGIIWANQWQSNTLFGIDPNSGEVLFTADVSTLQKEAAVSPTNSVTNGIAYDAERKLFWLTGKYWKYRYLVKLSANNNGE